MSPTSGHEKEFNREACKKHFNDEVLGSKANRDKLKSEIAKAWKNLKDQDAVGAIGRGARRARTVAGLLMLASLINGTNTLANNFSCYVNNLEAGENDKAAVDAANILQELDDLGDGFGSRYIWSVLDKGIKGE